MDSARALTIDLDDTLWAVAPVIIQAEKRMYEWLTVNCPAVTHRNNFEDLRTVRAEVEQEFPALNHDLTTMRKLTLERVLIACGYDDSYVNPAFEAFMQARNDVSLFPDVSPSLEQLSQRYPLVSVSNGNADLTRMGIGRYFTASVSAREVGAAKPHARMFMTACERLKCAPEHVIHIGDHPQQDILGASKVGMKTIWINRQRLIWDHKHQPDAEVNSLSEVTELLLR